MHYIIILPNGEHYSNSFGSVIFASTGVARQFLIALAENSGNDPAQYTIQAC